MAILRSALLALLAGACLLPGAPALAGQAPVTVSGAWSRASIGTARPGVLYLDVTNISDSAITLTGIETDVAAMPELHRSVRKNGNMQMTPVGDVRIAPGETLSLAPGGYHAMLMELRRPLTEGESYDATLVFENAGTAEITVPVRGMAATGPDG